MSANSISNAKQNLRLRETDEPGGRCALCDCELQDEAPGGFCRACESAESLSLQDA